jgi:hypothetical protein
VAKTFRTRDDFYKGTKICDSGNFALVYLPGFRFFDNLIDDIDRFLCADFVCGSDVDSTIIFNVDLNPSSFDNTADNFPTRANNFTHFILFDLKCENTWCVF